VTPLDRGELLVLLRSKPVSDWEKAILVLQKYHLVYFPVSDRSALGLPPKPAPSEDDVRKRREAQEKRVRDQQAAAAARKERRRKAHEDRTALQLAAAAKRKEKRLAAHSERVKAQARAKARRELSEESPKAVLRTLRESVDTIIQESTLSAGKEIGEVLTWWSTLPEPFPGKQRGRRWVARPPNQWGREGSASSHAVSNAQLSVVMRVCIAYNNAQRKMSDLFHEVQGIESPEDRKQGRAARKARTEETAKAGVQRRKLLPEHITQLNP